MLNIFSRAPVARLDWVGLSVWCALLAAAPLGTACQLLPFFEGGPSGRCETPGQEELAGSAGLGLQLRDGGVVEGADLWISGSPVCVDLQDGASEEDLRGAVENLLLFGCAKDFMTVEELSGPERLPR